MTVESAQLLCSVFDVIHNPPYKRTHYNNPPTVWTRTSKQNFEWLLEHGYALSKEYTKAYKKIHKSNEVLDWCKNNYEKVQLPDIGLTPFILCMPEQYKVPGDPITSYRNFYKGAKIKFAKWTHGRQQPHWW